MEVSDPMMPLLKTKAAHHPIRHSLADATGTLQRVSVHSGANVVISDFRALAQDPTAVGGEGVRCVEQHFVRGLLQDRHSVRS